MNAPYVNVIFGLRLCELKCSPYVLVTTRMNNILKKTTNELFRICVIRSSIYEIEIGKATELLDQCRVNKRWLRCDCECFDEWH